MSWIRMVRATIVNVVATSNLNQKIDLKKVGKLKYAFHDETVYHGQVAYIKTPEMKGKVSVFNSGKMISVGTTSEDEASNDLNYTMDLLSKANLVKPCFLETKIQNIVAIANLEKSLDFNEVATKFKSVIYEPEQFPSLIIRLDEPSKITVLLFASGKAVITGLRNREHLNSGLSSLLNKISTDH